MTTGRVDLAEVRRRFRARIRSVWGRWLRGMCLAQLLRIAAVTLPLLLVMAALDMAFAPGQLGRTVLLGAFVAGVAIAGAAYGVGLLRLRPSDVARFSDRQLKRSRQPVLTALELSHTASVPEGLGGELLVTCLSAGDEALCELRSARPTRTIIRALRRLLIVCVVVIGCASLHFRGVVTGAARVLSPGADIPPFSLYTFTVTPAGTNVVYGQDQVVMVEVHGPRLRRQPLFVTREGAQVYTTSCFQESDRRFAQRLEKVTRPVEFCFRMGRARSRWHSLDVLYQPEISKGRVTLTPPAYSRLKPTTFTLGDRPLAGLRGTRLTLELESNRPLGGGSLRVMPLDGEGEPQTTTPDTVSGKTAIFNWVLEWPGDVDISILDVRGTPCREPLQLTQQVLPDLAPTVSIHTPAPYSLATPAATIPLVGRAQDDLGLRQAAVFRAVTGFQDRQRLLPVVRGDRTARLETQLVMPRLGVEAGQTLEFFLEAADTNPELTGLSASEPARVQIISEEEYAEMIRARVTLDDFQRRFRAVADLHQALRKELAETLAAIRSGELDQEQMQQRLAELREQLEQARDAMQKLAGGYAAFDLEKALAKTAEQMAADLDRALAHTGWTEGGAIGAASAVAEAMDALGDVGAEIAEQRERAEEAVAVARVMACSVRFKQLYERQKMLSSRLERYARGERRVLDLGVMGDTQEGLRKQVQKLEEDLKQALEGLPPGEYEALAQSGQEFLDAMRQVDIPAPMQSCEASCGADSSHEASAHAHDALNRMERLLSSCKGGCMDCSGGEPRFSVPKDLGSTMSELLKSLQARYSTSAGYSLGVGAAGGGLDGANDGSYLPGMSPLNVPIYGPKRHTPDAYELGRTGQGGNGGAGDAATTAEVAQAETMGDMNYDAVSGGGLALEMAPPRYREAVKRFFETDPGQSGEEVQE